MNESLLNVAREFLPDAEIVSIESYGCGHINDTYLLTLQEPATHHYILQRINKNVFKKPLEVMSNIAGVTAHVRKKIEAKGGDVHREVLNLVHTSSGNVCFEDQSGEFWRVYLFIEDTITYQLPDSPELFARAAKAFGEFQSLLSDYPAESLFESIVGFHNTPSRCDQLEAAASRNIAGRLAEVGPELDFARARYDDARVMVDLQKEGQLPIRVTHNDTKLNNVLIDAASGEGLCVVDLDTVMPGLSGNDFGDAIRFGANTAVEDETDLSKVNLSLPMFEAYVRGYLNAARDSLTELEIRMLPMGSKLMTFECGMRFLADYLNGDVYFKIAHPKHNLDRARNQFKLVADMEAHWAEMAEIVERLMN